MRNDKSGKLFVVSAPSGAGKTTLVTKLLSRMQDHVLARAITYTSKKPRQCEQHGRDYFFLSEDEFREKAESGFFLEWSNAYGAYYGSARSIIDAVCTGASYFLIVDRAGAEKIAQAYPEGVFIWLYTRDIETLRQRLSKRGAETDQEVEQRLAQAVKEIEEEVCCPLYTYHILNDDFSRALRRFEQIIRSELGREG